MYNVHTCSSNCLNSTVSQADLRQSQTDSNRKHVDVFHHFQIPTYFYSTLRLLSCHCFYRLLGHLTNAIAIIWKYCLDRRRHPKLWLCLNSRNVGRWPPTHVWIVSTSTDRLICFHTRAENDIFLQLKWHRFHHAVYTFK